MDVAEERPRLEVQENEKLTRVEPPNSPPPNCAICLGTCANKCFTDCCFHQFCFNCLLEWSKIKAECPLCKQPFKSIIYNIKSNSEYEEHVIPNPEQEIPEEDILEQEDPYNFYLPNGPRPQRHFQFRTTLTVDPGGELAIQQLLLSHPLTNTLFLPGLNRFNRNRQRSIAFRRAIYQNGWWAQASPDITGRYRECSPSFFRENPAQTHRIQPWLNRELGALIDDYIEIFVAQQTIMELICDYPIQSSTFRARILRYLRTYTDHFIHEFYNFVRSPLDMIGYDSHVRYSFRRPENNVSTYHSVSDDDSDVRVVDSPNDCIYVEPRTPEVIVIHSDNSDSDVIFRTPTPPVVVDLLDSDTDEPSETTNKESNNTETSTKLPIKLRLKLKKNSPKRKKKYSKRRYEALSNSSSRSNSSSHVSDNSDEESSSDTGSDWTPVKSENRYTQPLVLKRKKLRRESEYRSKSKRKYNIKRFYLKGNKKNRRDSTDYDTSSERSYTMRRSSKKSSRHKKSKKKDSESTKKIKKRAKVDTESDSETNCSNSVNESLNDNLTTSSEKTSKKIKEEITASIPLSSLTDMTFLNYNKLEESKNIKNENLDVAGPSSSNGRASVIVKPNSMWYSRPDFDDTSSNNSD